MRVLAAAVMMLEGSEVVVRTGVGLPELASGKAKSPWLELSDKAASGIALGARGDRLDASCRLAALYGICVRPCSGRLGYERWAVACAEGMEMAMDHARGETEAGRKAEAVMGF